MLHMAKGWPLRCSALHLHVAILLWYRSWESVQNTFVQHVCVYLLHPAGKALGPHPHCCELPKALTRLCDGFRLKLVLLSSTKSKTVLMSMKGSF